MAGEDIYSWSTVAGDNAIADGSINWAEHQARASVNNSARSMMAAVAKWRNLQDGSITAGGSANNYTFTSGVGYGPVPPNWLKITLGFVLTNNGPATLAMDGGPAAYAIVNCHGKPLTGGELVAGTYANLLFDGSKWILLADTVQSTPHSGIFFAGSATQVNFHCRNGGSIKVNGRYYRLPVNVTGSNTGVIVDGAGPQNLVANTGYLVFLADFGTGALSMDFRTYPNPPWTHATSTSPGNEGVEVLSNGSANFDAWTLVGMVQTDASARFVNNFNNRNVISWFNRRSLPLNGFNTGGNGVLAATPTEIFTGARAFFLTWGEEAVGIGLHGYLTSNLTGNATTLTVRIDSTTDTIATGQSCVLAGALCSVGGYATANMVEGYHNISPFASTLGGGTTTYNVTATGMIRG